MMELVTAAFMPVNVVLTVLLILMVLYWLMVIIGAMDADLFEIDFDADADVDIDFDAELDFDVESDVDADLDGGGVGRGILEFFYIGEVPIMILISLLILSMWAISMMVNHMFNPMGSLLLGMPIFAGNLFVSLMICKVFVMPFRKMFSSLNKDANASRPVMGRICTVVTTQVSEKMGQAEMSSKGAPILLNVVAEGGNVFHKGDEAVVISKNVELGVYTIAPVDLE